MDTLSNYIIITKQKNGMFRFKCSYTEEGNIYRLLNSLGFHRTNINGKVIHYRKSEEGITQLDMDDIRMEFRKYLKTTQFSDLPPELPIKRVVDWFWEKKNLVRENDLFKDYVKRPLSIEEAKSILK